MRDTPRSAFPHFCAIATRWMDNDVYGHVNNVHYYSFFDTAVNRLLIERGVLDIHNGQVVGFVVETGCSYFAPVVFPDTVHPTHTYPFVVALTHTSPAYSAAFPFRRGFHAPLRSLRPARGPVRLRPGRRS
jgi:hypothetical protein